VEGEEWHKKTNVREIVFGFNDGTISTLALLTAVTGAILTHGQILIKLSNSPIISLPGWGRN
jgi:hypothetical protein